MEVQKSILIEAPSEEIWPYFVEPEKVLQWYLTFQKFAYVGEQRRGVGTKIYIEEKAMGPLMKMHFVVTKWVENQVLAIQMQPGPGPKYYEQRWSIEPASSGSSVTLWEKVELPYGMVGSLLEKVAKGSSEATVERILAKLKNLVEVEQLEKVPA